MSLYFKARVAENEALRCGWNGCDKNRYCMNRYCEEHANAIAQHRRAAAAKAWATRRARNPDRYPPSYSEAYWATRAIQAVNRAKRTGLLPDLSTGEYACTDCGGVASQYDHRDYARPLDVEPVCASCNIRRGTAKWPKPEDFQFRKLTRAPTNDTPTQDAA